MMVQSNLGLSTKGLNNAIERMSTGCKINHAKDNAANYSISRNYSSKLSSYTIAQENIAAGMDLVATAQDTISLMQDYGSRLHALVTQARNGTYGSSSLDAMTREAEAIVSEINRLQANTEYNDIKLFDGEVLSAQNDTQTVETLPAWAENLKTRLTPKSNGFIADIETVEPDFILNDASAFSDPDFLYFISNNNLNIKIGIASADALAGIATLVNSGMSLSGKTIVLTEDIDLSQWCAEHTNPDGTGGWTPIGRDYARFRGTFDGQGHVISGLYIKQLDEGTDSRNQGLFGYVDFVDGAIKNLGLENVNIQANDSNTGGISGCCGNIDNCYVTGNITGNDYVGGLVGSFDNKDQCLINNSYTTAQINGNNNVGGLTGEGCRISNSYVTGNVNGNNIIGGLCAEGGEISNCYTTGNVTGNNAVGGLIGEQRIIFDVQDCFATGNVSGTSNVGNLFGIERPSYYSQYCHNINCYAPENSSGGNENESETECSINTAVTTIQVGIGGDDSSKVEVNTSISFNLDSVLSDLRSDSAYSTINDFLETVNRKETELGAVANRLESALESTTTNINNLTSSLSTIKDADISKVSSEYIKQQILQQAAATLLSTANQQPSIALQLI